MTTLKPRGKIKRTNIYTNWEDQTDKYIYNKIEQHDSSKAKGEDQTWSHPVQSYSTYICPSHLPPLL